MKKLTLLLLSFLVCSQAWATNYCEDANIIGCWPLEEGSGTTTQDGSANNLDGTFTSAGNPAWYSTSTPDAWSTQAVDFSSDTINFGDTTLTDNLSTFSASFWVNVDTLAGNSRFVDKWGDAGQRQIITSIYDDANDNKVAFASRHPTNENYYGVYTTNGVLTVGSWIHVACVWSAYQTMAIYINGTSAGTSVWFASGLAYNTGTSTTQIRTGADSTGNNLDGKMDDVGTWIDAITSTEINDIMDNGLVGATAARRIFVTS